MIFLKVELEYNLSISTINFINYKKGRTTKTFAFTPSIFSGSFIISNMIVFEDLNDKQMGIDKTNLYKNNW